jgi:tetratricopeptide (TPR) repeat protein
MLPWLLLLLYPLQQEDFRQTAIRLHEAAQRDPSEENLLTLSRHLVAYNGAADAVKILTWGIEKHPQSAPLKVVLAAAHYALSDYDQAAKSICDAVDADPADLRTLVFLADFKAISPPHQPALAQRLKNYAGRYPENAFAQFHYALTLPANEQEPQLQKAIQLDPTLPGPALELGILLANRGAAKEALPHLQTAVRLQPNSQKAHYRLARLYQQLNQSAKAKPHLDAVRRLTAAPPPK